MADFQEDSQCCRGMVAESAGAGGAMTLHAGMGDEIPSGTPSRKMLKYSESGSAQTLDSDCHRPSREGLTGGYGDKLLPRRVVGHPQKIPKVRQEGL